MSVSVWLITLLAHVILYMCVCIDCLDTDGQAELRILSESFLRTQLSLVVLLIVRAKEYNCHVPIILYVPLSKGCFSMNAFLVSTLYAN